MREFHKLYYNSAFTNGTFQNTYWLGIPAFKCPLDLWIYQEIIVDLKPDVIIEAGTAYGGSALFLASICDLVEKGEVITIDIEEVDERPNHNRIKYLTGSSVSIDIVDRVKSYIGEEEEVMVILDSDHSKDHVLEELRVYGNLVTEGQYLVVEDTNLNGNPVCPDNGPGPMEAVKEFLENNDRFQIDESKEKFYLTFSPRGYLRKSR
ncbi:cephalosporin hydroxylase [candidate division MSBL1 archaeon SCGC-AAA382C18]|uniref:Cephalosporin hydroxylase n=1 Tax=candidate division MSBL1 archaeon SCGC-AAA382C18 TaxID=1698281 RepID=A0A133VLE1_9EURY|nr:cephalosporin hydroxylase [candidate division MSBL1 archaeon SCGC-AAA382C18]